MMERFKTSPLDKGYSDGSRHDGLFDPRHDYQPDERAAYRRGFDAARADRVTALFDKR